MKVLLVGDLSSTASLACSLAKSYQTCSFDYIGSYLNFRFDNLNYIDSKRFSKKYVKDIIEFIDVEHEKYDLIYAHDLIFQSSEDFQSLRSRIITPILCPLYHSSKLENSKLYAKQILNDLEIPTSEYFEIDGSNETKIIEYFHDNDKAALKLDRCHIPTGHGTFIADANNYQRWIDSIKIFYPDGKIYLEKFIDGREISLHILANGKQWIYLGSARDYKKIRESDQGINTTGAGSYSPVDYLTDELYDRISVYIDRLIHHLDSQGHPYQGILYLGLIIDRDGKPWVLEFNTRPGNPEFAAILPTIGTGLLENLYAAARGMPMIETKFNDRSAVSLQLLHRDYSYTFPKEIVHPVLEDNDEMSIIVFGRFNLYENIYACITAESDTRISAAEKIQDYLSRQDLGTYRFRRDIGIQI
jgi:phosphoribosylamine---glycine ligase